MFEKLKKDNFWLGMAMALIIPLVVFIIVYLVNNYFSDIKKVRTIIQDHTKYLIAVFFNLVIFRIYMVNWKMDKTGKGILAMTFLLAMGYLMLFQVLKEKYLFN